MSLSNNDTSSSEPLLEKKSSKDSNVGRLRRFALYGLLLLMLGALWYDRKVARPGVEAAYDRIERLNEEINSRVGRKIMTNKDVQATLNAAPDRVFTEGGYQVEVYSWRAGLPINTRDYYAVFSSAVPNRFLKHYKFELPTEELTGESAFFAPPADSGATELEFRTLIPSGGRSSSGAGEEKGE